MAQTTLLDGLNFARGNYNQDLRNIRLAARTATKSYEPVILSQLTSELANASNTLEALITQETLDRTAADQVLNNLITSNFNTLSDAIQGVNEKETVAARVLDYADLATSVAGVDYNALVTSYKRWILVDNESDTTQNGIYYQQPTATPGTYTAVRVPTRSVLGNFPVGLEIFVDAGIYQNTVYWVFDEGTANEGDGFSVSFNPWQRPEFIQIDNNADSAFLSKIGNLIRAEIDDTYFRVASGELTWSAALVTWKGTVDSALDTLTALQSTVSEHTDQIETLQSDVAGHTTSISGLSSTTSSLQSSVTSQGTLITGLRTDVDTATTKNTEQDGRLTTAEGNITSLRTDVDAATTKNTEQDGRLTTAEGNINSLQTDVAALPSSGDVNSSILNFLQAASIRRTLTDGDTTDVDGLYQTTFDVDVTSQISTLGAGFAFRLVTLNDAAVPYTQSSPPTVTYPDINTVRVALQSFSGAVPNDTIEVSLQAFFA